MPKEVKKRGRRAEKARKEEKEEQIKQVQQEEEQYQQQYQDFNNDDNDGYYYDDTNGDQGRDEEQGAFFGLVDEQELEYFKQAESTLTVDAFGSSEERRGFVSSVFEESKGKELKLVTNHICSRLIERLILLANDRQVLDLFKALSDNFSVLVKHKFSSHVVETLLQRVIPMVEREILDPDFLSNLPESTSAGHTQEDSFTTVENLFLYMVNDIKPTIKTLPQHQYASHFLRLLLLILAGKPVPSATEAKSALRSRRSKVARKKIILSGTSHNEYAEDDQEQQQQTEERAYQVPKSFGDALDEILDELFKNIDTKQAREMSIHPISSPVIQLILGLESDKISKQNPNPTKIKVPPTTLIATLFPYSTNRYKKIELDGITDKDEIEKKTKEIQQGEEAYVEYLLSDAIGSHLLEAIINILPVKLVARLADRYMVGRIGKLVRRQESGNYVVQTLLRRMSGRKDIASKIMDELIVEIKAKLFSDGNDDKTASKVEGEEINYGLIRTIVEVASQDLGGYKLSDLVDVLLEKYDPKKDGKLLFTLLNINNGGESESAALGSGYDNNRDAVKMQKALLLQSLMKASETVVELVLEGLISIGDNKENGDAMLLKFGRDSILSHVFENALVVNSSSKNVIQRRRLLNHLSKSTICCDLAANVYGSHIVDKMWTFCFRLKFFRERIAGELSKQEVDIKLTPYGRSVWKNWKMDDYIRRRRDWWNKVKATEDEMGEALGIERKELAPGSHKQDKPREDVKKGGKTKHAPFNSKNRTQIY
ncbi:uncharacterized protein SAPINGB_P003074 [Magnusiomyces paraingens]|uniref:Nucleolar protein 9 n=1 Tax=Magnusiomyces paraingens TaxID=2606893 RepID=A0A5E8BKD8_9ASCO|nr:uncharacterized protein SAPINGB_P003074 [Saprochaete ingens]VVT51372.1 unnamed protein product [Saprochaete ingens]